VGPRQRTRGSRPRSWHYPRPVQSRRCSRASSPRAWARSRRSGRALRLVFNAPSPFLRGTEGEVSATPIDRVADYGFLVECCGDSRSYRAQAMRENLSSRTKTKTQDKGQPKALYSTVDFSKVDPLYKCRSVSFYREAGGLLHFREHPRVKRIKTECARLSSGNLQLGLHVIGAS
jgi:hypothetical protein